MAGKTVVSSDGSKAWQLEFKGEMHFGPFYFSAKPEGFILKDKIGLITDDILWSKNNRYTVVVEVSFDPSCTSILRVDLVSGVIKKLDSAFGLIVPVSVFNDGKVTYEWREKGIKETRQKM